MSYEYIKVLDREKILFYKNHKRDEISSRDELLKYRIGSVISYLNIAYNLNTGGFLTKIADDHFTYITPDFAHKYRVKFSNILKIWIGDVTKVERDLVEFKKCEPDDKKKHVVTIDDLVVYCASTTDRTKRFTCSNKYNMMTKWIKFFGKDKIVWDD